jgi:hypothetical protein
MAKAKTTDDRNLLLQMIEEAYRLPNWNATHLRAALRRVTPAMAAWRPPHSQHSIADIAVHCAYWKYALRRRLSGAARGSFPLKGSNWFNTSHPISPEKWTEYLVLLDDQHRQLCEAIAQTRQTLSHGKPIPDGQWTIIQRTFWLAIHDGYHTGQVNLIKAMYRRAHSK